MSAMGDASFSSETAAAGRGVAFLSLQSVSYNLLIFVFYLFIVHLLPQSAVGVMFGLQSVGGLFGAFTSSWVSSTVVRYVAHSLGAGDTLGAGKWYTSGVLLTLGFSLPAGAILLASTPVLSEALFGSHMWAHVLALYSVDFVLQQLIPVLNAGLTARSRFGSLFSVVVLSLLVKLAVGVPLLLMGRGLTSVVYAWIAADSLQCLAYFSFNRRLVARGLPSGFVRVLRSFGLPLVLLAGFNAATSNADRLAVLKIGGTASLGVYGSMLAAAAASTGVLGSFAGAAYPTFTRLNSRGQLGAATLTQAVRYYYVVSVPIMALLAALSPALIALFLGAPYVSGSPAFMLLVSSLGVSGLGGLLSNVYYSRGNAGTPVRIQLVAGAVFATGVIPLVYYYGLLGAAVSYGAANLVSTLWFAYALRKQGLLNVSRHFAAKGGALYLLTFAAGYTPAYLLSYRLTLLPVYTLLGAGVALAGLKYLGMVSEADAEVAATVFPGKLGKIAAALIHAVSAS